jgi:hypothetical protein
MSHALGWVVGLVVGPRQFQLKGWKWKVNRLLLTNERQETRKNETFLGV